jgi:transcriptional regulator with XRE-family HTH domain
MILVHLSDAREIVTMSRISAAQSKMARAAVGWGVRELAHAAKASPDTIARLERGELLRERTLDAIRAALEAAGVDFLADDGVRLRREHATPR